MIMVYDCSELTTIEDVETFIFASLGKEWTNNTTIDKVLVDVENQTVTIETSLKQGEINV